MKCVRIAYDFNRSPSAIIRAVGVSPEEATFVKDFASKVASAAGLKLTYRHEGGAGQWLEMLPNWQEFQPIEVCSKKLNPIIAEIYRQFIENQKEATDAIPENQSC